MAQINMGLDLLADNNLIFKRKFRWQLSLSWKNENNKIPPYYVKLAARPSLTIEETPINYLNGRMYIPGKAEWETLSVTFYDVAYNTNGPKILYSWLASVYDFTDPKTLRQNSKSKVYGGNGTLTLFDGCGEALEEWQLFNVWPTSVNFGDLDYASSDEVTIEATLRFSSVKYTSLCPSYTLEKDCDGCGHFSVPKQ